MTLGVFLSSGESLRLFSKTGQLDRFMMYLRVYRQKFDRIYIFSYAQEDAVLPPGVILKTTPFPMHRAFAMILLPFLHRKALRECDVLRVMAFPGIIPAMIAKFLFGKKVIATYAYDYRRFASLERAWAQWLLSFLFDAVFLKRVDRVIVTTRSSARALAKRGIETTLIPNGVDTTLFRPGKKNVEKEKTILFVGRFTRQKNLFALIDAITKLKKKDMHVLFVGDGPLHRALRQHALQMHVPLVIRQFIPHRKLPAIYRQADVFVLPSFAEGHPKVLLEAMSCGVPCVVSRYPGVEEMIIHRKNGWIVGYDPKSIRRGVSAVLEKAERKERLSKAGRETVVQSFNLCRLLQRETTLLAEVER